MIIFDPDPFYEFLESGSGGLCVAGPDMVAGWIFVLARKQNPESSRKCVWIRIRGMFAKRNRIWLQVG
mgnify:CR=1 FL=1